MRAASKNERWRLVGIANDGELSRACQQGTVSSKFKGESERGCRRRSRVNVSTTIIGDSSGKEKGPRVEGKGKCDNFFFK